MSSCTQSEEKTRNVWFRNRPFKVLEVGECWEVQGYKTAHPKGYFLIRFSGGKRYYLHRLSYEHWFGPIPKGLLIRHRCNNPKCINPKHLVAGTDQDNIDDAKAVKAFTHKTCRNGHDLTIPGSTKIVRRSNRPPHNKCVKCEQLRGRNKPS